MNTILASRFRTLTTRRNEILDERLLLDTDTFHFRLRHVNLEIVHQIGHSISIVKRWSKEPMRYNHKKVYPGPTA